MPIRLNPVLGLFVLSIITGLLSPQQANACPGTTLEVCLDAAKSVVIGKIVAIEKLPNQYQSSVEMGRATIEVSEVLKGQDTDKIDITCVIKVHPKYSGCHILRTYQTGDSGIWVIDKTGCLLVDGQLIVMQPRCGSLPVDKKTDVESMLKRLSARKWSQPVNGLKAWSETIGTSNNRPVIIFAVQNASSEDIYVPNENTFGFINATAKNFLKRFDYQLSGDTRKYDSVRCRKLAPGEIAYLHPRYTCIDLKNAQELPDGKYKVVITCENNDPKGNYWGTGSNKMDITAWTGKLSAPPVELILKTPKTK